MQSRGGNRAAMMRFKLSLYARSGFIWVCSYLLKGKSFWENSVHLIALGVEGRDSI